MYGIVLLNCIVHLCMDRIYLPHCYKHYNNSKKYQKNNNSNKSKQKKCFWIPNSFLFCLFFTFYTFPTLWHPAQLQTWLVELLSFALPRCARKNVCFINRVSTVTSLRCCLKISTWEAWHSKPFTQQLRQYPCFNEFFHPQVGLIKKTLTCGVHTIKSPYITPATHIWVCSWYM